LTNERMV